MLAPWRRPVDFDPLGGRSPDGTLSDSDPPAQADSGQLLSFDRFSSKDPFVQQADATAGATARRCASRRRRTRRRPVDLPTTPSQPVPARKPSRARISVNGTSELVDVGKTFPSSDPVFRLFSLTRTTVKIWHLAGGSLSSGDGTTTLTKGKKVTLMNTADGTRYELVLLSLS